MKFNWGTGIAVFYSSFVLIFMFVWYQSTKIDHALVSNTYYNDDYKFDVKKASTNNNLKNPLVIDEKNPSDYVFNFPQDQKDVKGTIIFFRPSDQTKDFKTTIAVNAQNQFSVSKAKMISGLWKVKSSWTANGESFYNEETLIR